MRVREEQGMEQSHKQHSNSRDSSSRGCHSTTHQPVPVGWLMMPHPAATQPYCRLSLWCSTVEVVWATCLCTSVEMSVAVLPHPVHALNSLPHQTQVQIQTQITETTHHQRLLTVGVPFGVVPRLHHRHHQGHGSSCNQGHQRHHASNVEAREQGVHARQLRAKGDQHSTEGDLRPPDVDMPVGGGRGKGGGGMGAEGEDPAWWYAKSTAVALEVMTCG